MNGEARVEEALSLVASAARSVRAGLAPIALERLVQLGAEGARAAALTYDPARGVSFEAWVSYRARASMIEGARRSAGVPAETAVRARALDAAGRVLLVLLERDAARPAPGAEDADARLDEYLVVLASVMAGVAAR